MEILIKEKKEDNSITNYYALMVYIVLLENTNKNHRLSGLEVMEKVKERFHFEKISKNTIRFILGHLNEFTINGYPIDVCPNDKTNEGETEEERKKRLWSERRQGYFLRNRYFTSIEIEQMIHALINARYVTEKHTKNLIEKLMDYRGPHEHKEDLLTKYYAQIGKNQSSRAYKNIYEFEKAIQNGTKCFVKTRDMAFADKATLISPYRVIPMGPSQVFVLFGGGPNPLDEVDFCEVSAFSSVILTDQPIDPITIYPRFKNGFDEQAFTDSPYQYIRRVPEEEWQNTVATFEILDGKDTVRQLSFNLRGKNRKYKEGDKTYLEIRDTWDSLFIKAVFEAFRYKLISPQTMVDQVQELMQQLEENYPKRTRVIK